MKKTTSLILLATALVLATAGCSTMYRGQDMSFEHCTVTVNVRGGSADADAPGCDILAQLMSADHDGSETSTPTASPTTSVDVGTPAQSGGNLLGKVVDAIAGSTGGDSGAGVPASGCAGGGCSVDE